MEYKRIGRAVLKYGIPAAMTIGGLELIREGLVYIGVDSAEAVLRGTTGAFSFCLSAPINLMRIIENEHVKSAHIRLQRAMADINDRVYESKGVKGLKKLVDIIYEI